MPKSLQERGIVRLSMQLHIVISNAKRFSVSLLRFVEQHLSRVKTPPCSPVELVGMPNQYLCSDRLEKSKFFEKKFVTIPEIDIFKMADSGLRSRTHCLAASFLGR